MIAEQLRPRPPVAAFAARAVAVGAKSAKVIRAASVVTAPWVRLRCQYGCGCYNGSLCCPPHTPTPEQTRNVLDSYRKAIFFEAGQGDPKRIAVALEREVFLAGYYKAFGLGAGPCSLCAKCAFTAGCRHPRTARPSMEACGIDVFATARGNGFPIEVVRDHKDPQHYYGMVLVE
jgi:predicted metal-binding protein